MENVAIVASISIWTYVLNLPSDLCLNLDDCFYILALTRTLDECQFYVSGALSNGIYILDMSNPILNVNDNKKPKGDNLKSLYSWLCRLDYTSETRMTELHKIGRSGSFEKCESCLLCKDD